MNKISILYEDDEILLVNKEYGVSVQGGAGIAHPLDEELSNQLGYKIFLVHRLDRETSGILIVAKNSRAAAKWTNLISTDQVKKEYTALCFGIPVINGKPCLKGKLSGTVEAHGRLQDAVTFFEVVKTGRVTLEPGEDNALCALDISCLHITLGSGRMHQIRIQMSKAMCPLLADDKHGNFRMNKKARKIGVKKLHLAATRLTVPVEGNYRTFEIPLPEHMERTLSIL